MVVFVTGLKIVEDDMGSKQNFKHETLQDKESISGYLEMLTSAFKNGELVFRNDREQMLMKPDGMVELEVRANKKNRKSELSITFHWNEKSLLSKDITPARI